MFRVTGKKRRMKQRKYMKNDYKLSMEKYPSIHIRSPRTHKEKKKRYCMWTQSETAENTGTMRTSRRRDRQTTKDFKKEQQISQNKNENLKSLKIINIYRVE